MMHQFTVFGERWREASGLKDTTPDLKHLTGTLRSEYKRNVAVRTDYTYYVDHPREAYVSLYSSCKHKAARVQ